jgi:hypothetical protein
MLGNTSEVFGAVTGREWLAAMAMQGVIAGRDWSDLKGPVATGSIAKIAYELADAMIKAAEAKPSKA